MARPSRQDQIKIRKELYEYFGKGCNALYTAEKSKHNIKTVQIYFKEFRENLKEELDDDFLARQKMAKETTIAGLEKDMDLIDEQMAKLYLAMQDAEAPTVLTSQYATFLQMRATIRQQKCDIEMMPTIDVSLDQMISEKINEESGNKQPQKANK